MRTPESRRECHAGHEPLGTVDALSQYDMVILACEGDPHVEDKPGPARQAMFD